MTDEEIQEEAMKEVLIAVKFPDESRCRSAVWVLYPEALDFAVRTIKAEEAAKELQALFDLQQTRYGEATKMWRDAHPGNDLVMPDLGALLEWMMSVMKDTSWKIY